MNFSQLPFRSFAQSGQMQRYGAPRAGLTPYGTERQMRAGQVAGSLVYYSVYTRKDPNVKESEGKWESPNAPLNLDICEIVIHELAE